MGRTVHRKHRYTVREILDHLLLLDSAGVVSVQEKLSHDLLAGCPVARSATELAELVEAAIFQREINDAEHSAGERQQIDLQIVRTAIGLVC